MTNQGLGITTYADKTYNLTSQCKQQHFPPPCHLSNIFHPSKLPSIHIQRNQIKLLLTGIY